jgi:hypothetical protein
MSRFENDWKSLRNLHSPAQQQLSVVRRIARGNTESILPMIAKLARASWEKLPPHTRQWYKLEDSIASGEAYTVYHIAPEFIKTFKPRKASKVVFVTKQITKMVDGEAVTEEWTGCGYFGVYAHLLLSRFYITAETEWLRADKRWEGTTVSYDTSLVPFRLAGINKAMSVEFYITHTTKSPSPDEEIIQRLDATKAFLLVYDAASPNLRKYLIKWFLSSKTVRNKEGQAYADAKKELAILASKIGLSCQMGIFLATNDQARAECALAIARTFRTNNAKLQRSLEKETLETALMA